MAEPLDNRLRLRRLDFPRLRPRGAPYGYVDGVGWLSKDLLWIDGWLTLQPQDRLEVQFRVQGATIRREAFCLVRPATADDPHAVVRHWALLVPVDQEFATASRIGDLTLGTDAGDLLWHGARDRFIFPEIGHRLSHPDFPPPLLADLDTFIEGVVGTACEDLDDPVLRRNLEGLFRARTRERRSHGVTGLVGETVEPGLDTVPPTTVEPKVSIILTLLEPPLLLDDHFLYLGRSRPAAPFELIVVLGLSHLSAGEGSDIDSLSDLYGLGVRVLRLDGASWPAAARLAAAEARGELLVFVQGHTLTLDRSSLPALLEPFEQDGKVGVTAPSVLYFDGMPRSVGYEIGEADGRGGSTLRPINPGWTVGPAEEGRIAACSAECFAVRKHLIADVGAFSGRFLLEDSEVMDLCLGANGAGYDVLRVGASVTRMIERGAGSPSGWGRGILGRYEHCRLARRRAPALGEAPAGDVPDLLRPTEIQKVTVVIPTYEPGEELAEVLDRVREQVSPVPFEVLVIDSGSRDGTTELLASRGIRYIVIDKRQFNHGLTRNLGIQHAEGDVVAFLSQDALPEPGWLAGLLDAFREPMVVGAYSRQLHRSGASLWTRQQLARWPATSDKPRRQTLPSQDVFAEQSLNQKLRTVCFDNVSSAVRRSVALEIPFRQLSFGEDRDWAYRVMAAGYCIEFSPASTVIHSHDRSLRYELRRTVADHRSIHELLMPGTAPASPRLLGSIGAEFLRLLDVSARAPSRRERVTARFRVPLRALVGPVGGYLASRTVHMGAAGSRLWSWLGSRLTGGI